MREIAEHPAQGVAQLAVGLDRGLEDFRPDAQIVGSSRRRTPTAARYRRPTALITSCGATTLPSDFDILRPSSSSTKPWVSTTSKGARPRVPQLSSSEDWNQPRCWSEPSRYMTTSAPPSRLRRMPARPGKCSASSSVNAWVEPESNQTSRMSSTLLPVLVGGSPRKRSRASAAYQASAPSLLEGRRDAGIDARVVRGFRPRRRRSRTKSAIGTPQARWRESTQSGRLSIMPVMRFSPCGGTQRVTPIAAARGGAACRRPASSPPMIGLSMAMNHCGVLRKITGFFERHECGY